MTTFQPPVVLASTPATTPAGTPYKRQAMNIGYGSTENAYVYVPDKTAPWTQTRFVLLCHGLAATYTISESTYFKPTVEKFLDWGWVVASHDQGGVAHWGSEVSMTSSAATYDYVARRWHIDKALVWGFSMGGLTALNIVGRKAFPRIVGAITVNGVVDTHTFGPGDYSPHAAYGATDNADLAVKQAGYDPMRDDPAKWSGIPILQIAGTGDSTCHPDQHAKPFEARVPAEQITTELGTWGHLNGPFYPEKQEAFAASLMPAYDQDQTIPPGDPLPGWADDPVSPPDDGGTVPPDGSAGSGVYWTDGREASLYHVDGTLVRPSRS